MKSKLSFSVLRKIGLGFALLMIFAGLALLLSRLYRPLVVIVDGAPFTFSSFALTPRRALKDAGYDLRAEDRLSLPANSLLWAKTSFRLDRARTVSIYSDGQEFDFLSSDTFPANLLQQAGLRLYPNDFIFVNGLLTDPGMAQQRGQAIRIEVQRAKLVILDSLQASQKLFTRCEILSCALAEAGITINEGDVLSLPIDTPLSAETTVQLRPAQPLSAKIGDEAITGRTAATTTGEALQDLGLAPVGLDRCVPAEDEALPADGVVELVRVREEFSLLKDEAPFGFSYSEDSNADLDTSSVIQAGVPGIRVTRESQRYENDKLLSRTSEGPWQASEVQNAVLGRGSRVSLMSEVVDGQTLSYWRKVSVYATSYHPAEFSNGAITRSGLPLTKGIIAVSVPWYNSGMAGQAVYVPGYGHGIIADTGGGIPGRYWIDLGFDDANYEGWHYWTTLYFLAPIPAYVPLVLP